jgi:tetratricopeptide (TPR) repeat protein
MVAIAPQSAVARFSFAHALIATNHFGAAIEELDRVDANHSWLRNLEYFWLWKIKAHHFNGDFEGALREAERTNDRFPSNLGLCLYIADQHAAMGHENEMNAAIAKCAPLASDSAFLFNGVAAEADAHAHSPVARRLWERALRSRTAKNPNAPAPNIRAALGQWTQGYALLPRLDSSSLVALGQHGVFAAHAGDTPEARHLLQHLEELSKQHASQDNDYWRAVVTLALGDREGAVSLLQRARAKGMVPIFRLHAEPMLRDLEGYPPFRALTAPIDDRP